MIVAPVARIEHFQNTNPFGETPADPTEADAATAGSERRPSPQTEDPFAGNSVTDAAAQEVKDRELAAEVIGSNPFLLAQVEAASNPFADLSIADAPKPAAAQGQANTARPTPDVGGTLLQYISLVTKLAKAPYNNNIHT